MTLSPLQSIIQNSSIPISNWPQLLFFSSYPQLETKAFVLSKHSSAYQYSAMVNPKKLLEMARKWQKVAVLGRRVSSAQTNAQLDSNTCSTSPVADKGHFVVYSSDGKRFMVPLGYLESSVFVELFKMSEDEFGLPRDGPITFPCDTLFLEHVLSVLRRRGPKATDRMLFDSVFKHHRSPCSLHLALSNQRVVCSF